MTYSHAETITKQPEYWCPICHVPVASVTVRTVHTGPDGEVIHNHHNRALVDGRYKVVHHTVITRQDSGSVPR